MMRWVWCVARMECDRSLHGKPEGKDHKKVLFVHGEKQK
jgi:hypothetical protein